MEKSIAFKKFFVSSNSIKSFLGKKSSVVGLFIDFLTSGLSFEKNVEGVFYGNREVFLIFFFLGKWGYL